MNKRENFQVVKIIVILFVFVLTFCGTGDDNQNGDPVISSLSPSSRAVHMPGFTLTVRGTGFSAYSSIYFDDKEQVTNFISTGELSCFINSDLTASFPGSSNVLPGGPDSAAGIPVLVNNGGGHISETSYFTVRDNNSFNASTLITSGISNSFNPSIALGLNDVIFIAYERYDDSTGDYFVSVIRSEDGGEAWTDPVDVFSSDQKIYNPEIVSKSDGTLYITFYNLRLYFSSSSDSGKTWSSAQILSFDTPTPIESRIAVDGSGNIHVLWLLTSYYHDTNIYFRRSSDGALTFSSAVNISSDKNNFSSVYSPCLAASNGGIYAGWTAWPSGGSRYSYVYANRSDDNGDTWTPKDKYFGVCSSPDVAAGSGSSVYLVLSSSYLPFSNQIVLFRSEDGGVNMGTRIPVTSESDDTFPFIRIDKVGNLNIIFKRGDAHYYTRSIDGGDTWTAPLFVTDRTSHIYNDCLTSMALDTRGNMYIVTEYDNSGILYLSTSY